VIDKILRKLVDKGGELAAGELAFKPAQERRQAIERLVGEGSLSERREGRKTIYALTGAGRERAAALPAARPAAARRRPEDVTARLDRIEAKLDRIEALLAPRAEPAAELKPVLLEVIAELDAAHRYGGLVPLPEIRQALRRRGVGAADASVNAALEELERDYAIDLSIAQSPTTVPDRAAGIERPGRGLVYYVVRRQN
jgi:hypothetical protein